METETTQPSEPLAATSSPAQESPQPAVEDTSAPMDIESSPQRSNPPNDPALSPDQPQGLESEQPQQHESPSQQLGNSPIQSRYMAAAQMAVSPEAKEDIERRRQQELHLASMRETMKVIGCAAGDPRYSECAVEAIQKLKEAEEAETEPNAVIPDEFKPPKHLVGKQYANVQSKVKQLIAIPPPSSSSNSSPNPPTSSLQPRPPSPTKPHPAANIVRPDVPLPSRLFKGHATTKFAQVQSKVRASLETGEAHPPADNPRLAIQRKREEERARWMAPADRKTAAAAKPSQEEAPKPTAKVTKGFVPRVGTLATTPDMARREAIQHKREVAAAGVASAPPVKKDTKRRLSGNAQSSSKAAKKFVSADEMAASISRLYCSAPKGPHHQAKDVKTTPQKGNGGSARAPQSTPKPEAKRQNAQQPASAQKRAVGAGPAKTPEKSKPVPKAKTPGSEKKTQGKAESPKAEPMETSGESSSNTAAVPAATTEQFQTNVAVGAEQPVASSVEVTATQPLVHSSPSKSADSAPDMMQVDSEQPVSTEAVAVQ